MHPDEFEVLVKTGAGCFAIMFGFCLLLIVGALGLVLAGVMPFS